MKLADLTDNRLEELRADLEPHIGRAIQTKSDGRADLEDAIRSVLDNLVDSQDPALVELLGTYGVPLEEEEPEAAQEEPARKFDHEPTAEEIDTLAAALDSDNANNIGSALAAIMATPVPSRKDPRKELARWALAEANPLEASESDATPEEDAGEADAQEDGQEEGSADTEATGPVILQLMCRPSGVAGLWDRDIIINPDPELEHQIRTRYAHSEVATLEQARGRIKARIGRLNVRLSNLDGVEV